MLTVASKQQKHVLVIGAGVSGATAASRLAQAGCNVHLVEKKSAIGGHAVEMGCKATDRCLRCNVCVANDRLRAVLTTPGVHIHTRSELSALTTNSANPGARRYTAVLAHRPTYINAGICTGCMLCVKVCPEKCIMLANLALAPAVPVVDEKMCLAAKGKDCAKCQQACPVGAINLKQKDSHSTIDVDAVVIATGYQQYDPADNNAYGYARVPNVITALQAERQLAELGRITRPSDAQPPQRIAFIQCVGSRTEEIFRRPEDTNYCSVVCCAYALRIARLLKYQCQTSQITVFYMDIQNFGKDFDGFYGQCQDKVRFIRARPFEVNRGSDGAVSVKYSPPATASPQANSVCEEQFDLVILATGIRPGQENRRLSQILNVPLDEDGFFGLKTAAASPDLQQKGIFAAGAAESPADIAGCIARAEAACAELLTQDLT
jgi:heterodisulfide reductase subunit A